MIVLVPALTTAIAIGAGAAALHWRAAVIEALVAGVGVGVLLFVGHASGIHTDALVEGLLLGGLVIGALPVLLYYAVGRLVKHPVAVGIVWLVSLVPLYLGLLVAGIYTFALIACPPGSYECPV